jgi:Sec-independent protein secretion pathway component TatC
LDVRTARNVAIIMALALGVAFAPAGGNVVDVILTAMTMGFMAGIAWMLYVLSRQNQLTLATLSDGRRAIFYGAFGLIALLVAGTDKLFATGPGTLLWIALLGGSVVAIWRIWLEANTY